MFYSDNTRKKALRVFEEMPTDDLIQIAKTSKTKNKSKYLEQQLEFAIENDREKHAEMMPQHEPVQKYKRSFEEDFMRHTSSNFPSLGSKSENGSKMKSNMPNVTMGQSKKDKINVVLQKPENWSQAQKRMHDIMVQPTDTNDSEAPGNVTN